MLHSKLNRFSKLRQKRSRFLNHLNFLTKCRKHKVIPKFISLKCSVRSSYRISKAVFRSHFAILRAVIQDTRHKLSEIENELYDLHLFLSKNYASFDEFERKTWAYVSNLREAHLKNLDKKFNNLSQLQIASVKRPHVPINNNFITNLSSHTLTTDQKKVLELGLNYSVSAPPSIPKLIAPIESSFKFSKITPAQKESLRHILANTIAANNSHQRCNLTSNQKRALHELKSNNNLVITKADKGGQIVLLDKSTYINKVNALLNEGPYIEVKKDPTNTQLSKLKQTLKNSVLLQDTTKRSLIPSAPHFARFYALPKVHKPNIPFRPIVSNIGTVTYPLAKFLASSFSPLCVNNTHTVRNSYDFVNKIRNISPSNCSMLSLDVKSLFTNVPIQGALNCLEMRLREFHYTDFEIKELLSLTKFCIEQTTFSFNNKFYKQLDGLAMGNPLSPILCDIYMHYFEEKLFQTFKPKCWLRYVDDTFILINNPLNLVSILNTVNSIDSNIQFTAETEIDRKLSFLDVLVTRFDSNFETSVFRKNFAVSLPPHALSNHPVTQKMAAFYTYVYRAINICSNNESLSNELSYLKSVAINRGFNPSIIDKAVAKFRKPAVNSTLLPIKNSYTNNIIVLPFYSNLSYKLAKVLKRFNFNVVFKPINKFHFPSTKTNIPTFSKSGVYKIPCKNCNLFYIGQTKRPLYKRIGEHKNYVRKQQIQSSGVAKHSWNFNHVFNFSEAEIIYNASNPRELDVLESISILLNSDNIVNEKNEFNSLSPAWKNLF